MKFISTNEVQIKSKYILHDVSIQCIQIFQMYKYILTDKNICFTRQILRSFITTFPELGELGELFI